MKKGEWNMKYSIKNQTNIGNKVNQNLFRIVKLNNDLSKEYIETNSVAVPFSFLQEVLKLETKYHMNERIKIQNTHEINPNHVTPITLRVMTAICRFFNTEGYLSGVSIHRLYKLTNKEYEVHCSKEQFYTEFYKLLNRQIIVATHDGLLQQYRIADHLLKNKRFVLFSPAIFTKSFTDMSAAAQKLYFYMMSRINNHSVESTFVENISVGSWIYTLTHKNRPSQINSLLNELAHYKIFNEVSLLREFTIYRNHSTNLNMISVTLSSDYIIKYEEKWNYRSVPEAKLPYKDVVKRVRNYVSRYQLKDFFNGLEFTQQMELIRYIKDKGRHVAAYLFKRLAELYQAQSFSGFMFEFKRIKKELELPQLLEHIKIMKHYGVIDLLDYESNDDLHASEMAYLISDDAHYNNIPLDEFESVVKQVVSSIPKITKEEYIKWLYRQEHLFHQIPKHLISLKTVFTRCFNLA